MTGRLLQAAPVDGGAHGAGAQGLGAMDFQVVGGRVLADEPDEVVVRTDAGEGPVAPVVVVEPGHDRRRAQRPGDAVVHRRHLAPAGLDDARAHAPGASALEGDELTGGVRTRDLGVEQLVLVPAVRARGLDQRERTPDQVRIRGGRAVDPEGGRTADDGRRDLLLHQDQVLADAGLLDRALEAERLRDGDRRAAAQARGTQVAGDVEDHAQPADAGVGAVVDVHAHRAGAGRDRGVRLGLEEDDQTPVIGGAGGAVEPQGGRMGRHTASIRAVDRRLEQDLRRRPPTGPVGVGGGGQGQTPDAMRAGGVGGRRLVLQDGHPAVQPSVPGHARRPEAVRSEGRRGVREDG